jgi:hypothetical protein
MVFWMGWDGCFLPPLHLNEIIDPPTMEPVFHPNRNIPPRRIPYSSDRSVFQVIKVIMRNEDDVEFCDIR